ncbi:NUDIX hydrolase [Rhodococcus sp. OK302]|uniref:NUDIX hydrolase n=1 Tax=Rhodococcus sp. OK302 TaxID=1882769 RepID=UPI000B93AC73|nr:NUDIX hydrolase [Rhodococcus sp. OK302]OYD67258.1 ADP-ribose pyrophosphatase YjhB (NUDIX family) [Rhodococcus sp. OK302]
MDEWKDSTGHALTDYPRPSIAVDVAVLTYSDSTLKVLAVKHRRGKLALPGTFLHERELLTAAADRALQTKADMANTEFHQLAILDNPDRDDRGWVLSVAHAAAIPQSALPTGAILLNAYGADDMAFDHTEIVRLAVTDLRHRYAVNIDPTGFLGDTFTVPQLRQLYEVVFDRELQKDGFRRHVIDSLISTGEYARAGTGRPAETYRRKPGVALPAQALVFLTG